MAALNPQQEKFQKKILSGFYFKTFVWTQVPMGALAGMKIIHLSENLCQTTIPNKWLNKNPFKSIYFAAQSMAAELSTAVPCLWAIQGYNPSVAFIIVDLKASFPKKAVGKVTFTCLNVSDVFNAVEQAIQTGEAQTVTLRTEGKMQDGTVVSVFDFTWSFKQRGKK